MGAANRNRSGINAPGGIFTRLALRSLKLNRTRSIVTVIGIALSCALITAILTSVTTLYSGLRTAVCEREGSWQVELLDVTREGREALARDPRVESAFERDFLGSALMPTSFEGYWGRYLDLNTWPSADSLAGLKPAPRIVEGRAPRADGEIVLTLDLRGATVETGRWLYDTLETIGLDDEVARVAWDDEIELGTSIEISLGQRMLADVDSGQEWPCGYDEAIHTETGPDGDFITEYLADTSAPRPFTVVGFCAPADDASDQWGAFGGGYLGFVADDSLPVRSRSVYVATDLTDRDDLEAFISDYTASPTRTGGAYIHEDLLRYTGLNDDSHRIWGTLFMLSMILSGVVIVASVSLIYNAFAIAISERTRQFGLLASLGASKRQLRRCVYAEALVLAAVGIPLGLATGIAGCLAVFSVAGEGIGLLLDSSAFEGGGLPLVIDPVMLAIAAALAALTVFVSAALPAWRASRVSAVDAIRAARDVRPAKRERQGAVRGGRKTLTAKLDDLRLRLTGVPGLLAHRNLTRSSSKGRIAVASLAVSVALIIISGGIAHYMGMFTIVTETGPSDIEVNISRLLIDDETTSDGIASIEEAYRKLDDAAGVTGRGYVMLAAPYARFEAGMIDPGRLDDIGQDYGRDLFVTDGDGAVYAPSSVAFVDTASWREILDANDLDAARYSDPKAPVAVGLIGAHAVHDGRYTMADLFSRTGTATLFTHIATPDNAFLIEFGADENGEPAAVYERSDEEGQRYDEDGMPIYDTIRLPVDEVAKGVFDLPVGALVDTAPVPVKSYDSVWPTLVLPITALPTLAAETEGMTPNAMGGTQAMPFAFHSSETAFYGNTMSTYLSFDAEDPRAAQTSMNDIIRDELTGGPWHRTFLTNNAENARTSRLIYEAIRLFIDCFILITGAIAVANVFNTLTSSIVLRRREFAMLKSIGMGDRAFWRMIAMECLSYAWKGLVLGLALGAIVTFLIYCAMLKGFDGIDFTVSIPWVLAACVVVMAVLAASTAYAIRISGADSIVETLREDII